MNSLAIAAFLGTISADQLFLTNVTDEVEVSDIRASDSNPFAGKTIYPNPKFTANVVKTAADHPEVADKLHKLQDVGAFNWIDTIAAIDNVEAILQGAQASGQLAAFVIYDLPNRDCKALASNGEIHCEDANCAQGLTKYITEYITPIVNLFQKYPDVTIVNVIEPDSLPNLATNLDSPKCQQAEKAYKTGVSYTLKTLSALPNVVNYLDIAHGGWLGWDHNLQAVAPIFKEVLDNAGGNSVIRGWASNTANYQALGSINSSADPCNLKSQYNFAIDEIHYMNLFDQAMTNAGMGNMYFITDTSRNGVTNERNDCSNWCNIKDSGLGRRPSADVSDLGLGDKLDAVAWIKTPGESDGTTDTSSSRFDPTCKSQDAYVPSPEAGQWSEDFFVMLVNNANPAI